MEELHRLHKDVPFGWVALLQELFAERARRTTASDARVASRPASLRHVAERR
jgi:hypothetical protein